MGVGALTLPRLIAWAHKDRFGLAIGFYPETGAVRYQSIDIAGVDALAKR